MDGVSFTIKQGETFGLVGESGSGKSTTGRTVLRLQDKTSGDVLYKGSDLFGLSKQDMRGLRPKLQFIFQDPYSSLNPRMRIGEAMGEALLDHGLISHKDVQERVKEVMSICGTRPASSTVFRTGCLHAGANHQPAQ